MRGAVRLATSLPSYASFQICSFMAEDPEGIRRRVDQQQLRRQLHEVFGPFDQFAEYVSGSGSSGPSAMMRHGVVQIPTTPVVSSRSRLPVGGSSSPINQQSTQQLLQSMQNLVTSPPIQPIQLCTPFALKKDYLNTEPSSSTRSVVDGNDNYNKKKRKNRTVNSDSETDRERDKRKRTRDCSNDHDNAANASTSRGRRNTEDERLRALFGEDGDEDRKEPPDKPVSPDSGVHSTENDPGDENDMSAQNILSMITKLSPPLSPIRLRPKDKKSERETREKENREKEERSRKDLERREKEQREREAAERKEQERKDKEEREKKEREIAERKGQERKEREERERKEREEKEKREKEREEKERREREEKERKEKERQENDRREKDQKEKEEKERRRTEKERKEEVIRDSKTGLRGEIALRGLNPSRLSQLLELGKKTGKVKDGNEKDLEKKEIRREKERKEDKEKKKEKRDREKRRESETDFAKKGIHQEMVDMKIEPRPSSSQDVGDVFREFKCASSECCPPKAVRPEKPEPESTERLCDFYQSVARVRKRKADGESDKVQRMLLYLDCVVYFTLSAKHFQTSDGTENKASRQVTIVRDTCELLKLVTQHFTKPSDNISPLHHHLMSRVRNLSLRVQAVLAYHLYNFRSQQAFKAYTVLTQMDPHVIEEKKADATPSAGGGKTTPSPSSSVHSNSNQGVNTISMPTHVYQIQKQQLKTLHHLMWAHRIWGDAAERAGGNSADMTFITSFSLEKVCGHLCVDAPLEKMSSYLLTGVAWLRTEYEREKRRPPPPISAKRLS